MISERRLIERSRRGDAEAFGLLVRKYEDRIFRLAKSVCSRLPSEADDVSQETFLTAFKKLDTFREEAELGTWLYRIASNLCLMKRRAKGRERTVPLEDRTRAPSGEAEPQYPDRQLTPEERAGKKELVEQVGRALSALAPDYRMVVTLRDIEGLSNERTAEVLDLSVAAVKSRLHRGRLALKAALGARVH